MEWSVLPGWSRELLRRPRRRRRRSAAKPPADSFRPGEREERGKIQGTQVACGEAGTIRAVRRNALSWRAAHDLHPERQSQGLGTHGCTWGLGNARCDPDLTAHRRAALKPRRASWDGLTSGSGVCWCTKQGTG